MREFNAKYYGLCSRNHSFIINLEQDQDGADEEQVSVSDGNLKTVETKFDDGTTSENQLKTTSDSGRDEKVCRTYMFSICYLNDKLVTVDYVDTRACPPP